MAIKLQSFMTSYKFKKTEEGKKEFLLKYIKNEYVPYEKKADYAKAIVQASYYQDEKTPDGKTHRVFHVDSVAKYMLTCMTIVKLFTTIECSSNEGKMLEEFNMLNQSGIIDLIIQNISQHELKEFNMILQMTCDDTITNEYEPHAYIKNQVERFGQLIGTTLLPVIKQLDIEQIQEIVNAINGKGIGEI